MDCRECQERILESLSWELPAGAMEQHLAGCDACRAFAGVQRALDARLAAALPSAHPSAGFRRVMREKIRREKVGRESVSPWPDFLPELAHLGGCAAAIGVVVCLLPRYAGQVILAGAAFTGATYFLQSVLRTCFDALEGDA